MWLAKKNNKKSLGFLNFTFLVLKGYLNKLFYWTRAVTFIINKNYFCI